MLINRLLSARRCVPVVSCLILINAVPALSREIESVESNDPLPRPQVAFTSAADDAGIVATLSFRQKPPAGAVPKVTAQSGQGLPLPVTQKGENTWLIETPARSFVSVRIAVGDSAPAPAAAPQIPPTSISVYSGNLDEALTRLRERVAALPAPREGNSFAAVHQRDLREWLINRIGAINVQSDSAAKQLPSGALVTDLMYAEELLRLLEPGRDSVALARGRQLPARRTFEVKDGNEVRKTGFDFVLRLPKNDTKEPWPLLVLVHGSTPTPNIQGARRDEIDEAAAQMDFPFMTVGPVVNRAMGGGGGWNAGELATFVEGLIAQYPIDRDRVYLSGFSAGGYATVATVLRRPDLFAAYAPLCGSGDPSSAPALASIPAYLYHGDADGTVPCFGSVRFFQALDAAGAQPNLRVYKRMGHAVWGEVYRDLEFYKRLLAHRRIPQVAPMVAERGGEGNRLEFFEAAPVSLSQVCWVDQTLKLGDLWGQENAPTSLRQLQRKLEGLYPSLPIAGNVLVHCPEGWTDASSPVAVGIAVSESPTPPAGFIFRPLRTAGRMTASYRGPVQIADLAAAARRFQTLRTSEDQSAGKGLVLELEGSGRRGGGGSRVTLRAAAE